MQPQRIAARRDLSDNAASAATPATEEFCTTLMARPQRIKVLVTSRLLFPQWRLIRDFDFGPSDRLDTTPTAAVRAHLFGYDSALQSVGRAERWKLRGRRHSDAVPCSDACLIAPPVSRTRRGF